MVLMIRAVQVLAIPAGRVQDVRPDTAGARLGREALKVTAAVAARSEVISAEVGSAEATEAALGLVQRSAACRVSNKHAEALSGWLCQ
jgi:hypothetical protein